MCVGTHDCQEDLALCMTLKQKDSWKVHEGILSQTYRSSADYNMYPFTVINWNSSVTAFSEFSGPSSELLNQMVVPGSLEVATGVISDYGLGTLEFAFDFRSDSRLENFHNPCSGLPHCSWNKT